MTIRKLLVVLAAFALIVAACGDDDSSSETTTTVAAETTTTAAPATTTTTAAPETTTTAAAAPEVGSAELPIQVFFVPSVSAEDIIAGGELLDAALTDATGLEFEVSVGTSYAATIEAMCAAPENSIGFIPAQGYVLANDLCGVEIALKSIRFGYDVYWTQFIVPRDSEITSIEELAGKQWAYPDAASTSGFLVPSGLFNSLGIEVTDVVEAGGHSAVARAVYLKEADFGTTYYSPPVDSERNSLWDGVGDPDVPADLVPTCALDADGEILCGDDFFPRDARRDIREEAPDVIQQVRILAVSDPIPNDGMAFSPDFPQETADAIVAAMVAFAADDPEGFETAFDAYSWSGVAQTNDAEFDSIRALLQALGYTLEDF